MKTYRLTQSIGPEGLALLDEAIPDPGPGQALVRIRATAINYRDQYVLKGWIPNVKAEVVPLTDAAGDVVAIGAGVRRVAVGDRVVGTIFANWQGGPYTFSPEQFTVEHDGWLTEYKAVAAEALVRIPDNLSFEEAAAVVCTGTTAWTALDGVRGGDTVLTQGSGGVSLFAIQFAHRLGAHVIATIGDPDKADRLRALGADDVLSYRDADWGEQARVLTGGRGVTRVVEVGGASNMGQSLKAVATGGQISLVGILGGAEGSVDFMAMFAAQATVQPIPVGSRNNLEAAFRLIQQHGIRPVIDKVFDFSEVRDAFAYAAGGRAFGKVIIRGVPPECAA